MFSLLILNCFVLHAAQIKDAVLTGIALEDDKREQFNKIEQVCFTLFMNSTVAELPL